MPDLSNLVCPPSFHTPPPDLIADKPLAATLEEVKGLVGLPPRNNRRRSEKRKKAACGKSLDDHVAAWTDKKLASGMPERHCRLPFLENAPRMVDCRICRKYVYPGDEVVPCSVKDCKEFYHVGCAVQMFKISPSRTFKCPLHACFNCKQKAFWRCTRCVIAAHTKCAPWPERVIHPLSQPGRAVCWRHPSDWRLEMKNIVPTRNIEEIFCRLPLPYIDEEFNVDLIRKDVVDHEAGPSLFVHIRRNVYLVKKKRDDADNDVGCRNCNAGSTCLEDCVCRVQCISCSKACYCSETCTNRPFRRDKKIKVVKTKHCGWGVEAAEDIKKGDFIIEYIGEVIDDVLCEQRLWDMKHRGDQNFYMCEIRKDFTIDATFKGNSSRFLNHSCDPNCKLEKWEVDGETRVGVFASRSIDSGEPLTYDYRFVHFGPMVECCCGSHNCRGNLGSKRKIESSSVSWGVRRKRSSAIKM